MPAFKYKAMDSSNKEVSGSIDAANDRIASQQLRERGLRLFEIKASAGGFDIGSYFAKFKKKKVKARDKMVFTRQLSTLLEAGLPLLRGLTILTEQSENPTLREMIEEIKNSVQSGSSFSEAIAKYPDTFNKLYVSMVRAGEVGGVLEVVLDRLAEFAEKDAALMAKVKAAMIYPILMVCVAVTVVTILMAFVIPQFTELFASMGAELPLPTRILINISNIIKGFWWLIFGGMFGGYYGFTAWVKTPVGEKWKDGMILKLPIFGELTRKMITARFARTLGTLIQSGVPILQALSIVKDTTGNVVVGESMESVSAAVTEGEPIAAPLHRLGVFAPMVTNMIAVGEETGALDQMLLRIADNYDMVVEEAVKGLTSLMEPAIIVFMGVTVGFIVLALFMPLFDLGSHIKA
ncbi:TPA: type II secretion system protein GspF [bacterium]|nr:MAG: type II secretion system protein GspF [Candidatus Hydrogenedentes bacterium CG1_02_42_14]HBW46471.1 type II secretion system protein GspF [bacterium]